MILSERHKYLETNIPSVNKEKKEIYNEINKVKNSKDFVGTFCIICKSNKFNIINEIDRYGFFYPTGICKNCGMVQQSIYYTNSFLEKFYSKYYNLFYGHFKNPEERFNSQYLGAKKSYQFVKNYIDHKKTKILEIGCGAGGILKYYQDKGFYVKGLDYDNSQLNYGISKSLNLINNNYYNSTEKFDLIILSHVLEHMSEPEKEIDKIKQYLSKDGIVYIEVPSIHSIKNLNYNYNIRNFFHIAHFLHFSKMTFINFMKINNLKIIKINDDIQSIVTISSKKEEIFFNSIYQDNLSELKNIENFYLKNKVYLFIKKTIVIIKYNLIIFLKKNLSLKIITYIKKIYKND